MKVNIGLVRSSLNFQEIDFYQDKYGLSLREPCVEMIFVGSGNQKILFSERYFISNDNNHENDSENLIKLEKLALKKFYKSKKIKSGTLRVALPSSNIKSFVLGNLDQGMNRDRTKDKFSHLFSKLLRYLYGLSRIKRADLIKEEAFPFVLAHLKQHVGENLAQMRVDFTRLSDHQVWVVVCPEEEINSVIKMNSKKVPVVVVEPSLHALRRALCRILEIQGINEMSLKKTGLLWVDAMPQGKKFRLTLCEGVEVVWDKILEGSLEREIGQALMEYWFQIQKVSCRMFQRFYLFVEPEGVEALVGEIQRFFKNEGLDSPEVHSIFPEKFGLKQADEFVSYGLALR